MLITVTALVASVLVSAWAERSRSLPPGLRQSSYRDAAVNRGAQAKRPAGTLTAQQALQVAGEHVIFAYAGETPPRSLINAIRAGEVAGVILFAPNVANSAALAHALNRMQAAARASPHPSELLVMTDQEGGLVRRLSGAPTLSEKQIGEA